MTKKEKQEFRKMLLERKERIVHKLSEFINESKEIEMNVAQDVVDKAESSYTKEFLLSLSDTERDQLMLIDEAFSRLDRNDFGLCQLCNQEISRKRLRCPSLDAHLHQLPGKGRERVLISVPLPLFRTPGSWAELIELVFFPSFCRLCGDLLDKPGERVICADCWGKVRLTGRAICPSLREVS